MHGCSTPSVSLVAGASHLCWQLATLRFRSRPPRFQIRGQKLHSQSPQRFRAGHSGLHIPPNELQELLDHRRVIHGQAREDARLEWRLANQAARNVALLPAVADVRRDIDEVRPHGERVTLRAPGASWGRPTAVPMRGIKKWRM